MSSWTPEELTAIGDAVEVGIASLRRDGTLTRPRIVWAVRDGDEIYLRSVNGSDGAWYRSTRVRHEGRIRAGGIEHDIAFVDTTERNERVDAAYRSKYRGWGVGLDRITRPLAAATTMRLEPR
jgi:hypothetical protein